MCISTSYFTPSPNSINPPEAPSSIEYTISEAILKSWSTACMGGTTFITAFYKTKY